MTIIHITTSLVIGGGEQVVHDLSKKSNHSHKTIVFSITNENGLEQKFIDNNIEFYFLGVTSFKNKSLLIALKRFREIVSKLEDTVFHCHQFHGGLFGVIYNICYKTRPIIFTLHSNKVPSVFKRFGLFFTKPFRHIDVIFSKTSKKWYLNNTKIIPNGVDFSTYFNNKDEETIEKTNITFKFLFLGRLSKEKNPLFLITVAKFLLFNNFSKFTIDIVGDGPMRETLIEQIQLNNLSDYFEFHGFQINVLKHLNQSHCLILTSIREGMPLVLLEAAAVKLPIIATPVGSIPDYFNNSNANIVELNNFGSTMFRVVNNYTAATKKAELLHEEIINQFDINIIYKQYYQAYKMLLQKH